MTAEKKAELLNASDIVRSSIHPDTNKPLPWPMRISSAMPMNIPINMGFILAAPTIQNTVFWQVINQTYNAVLNYGNANATSPYTKQDLAKSYCMAVSVSMAVALTVRQVNLKRTLAATGSSLIMLNAATATTAAACGGFANNYFMRQSELERGIELCDPETGKPIGKSKLTAKSAVW